MSIAASLAPVFTLALPVSAKVRDPGRSKVRAIDSSGSERGGTGRTASRVITRMSGWEAADAPSASRRSCGIWMTSSTTTLWSECSSRSRISAKPTASAPPNSLRRRSLTSVILISSVEKRRRPNEIVCPAAVRDDTSSATDILVLLSKISWTLVIQRLRGPFNGCTRFTWLVVIAESSSMRMYWPTAFPSEAARHAVEVSPSSARTARSSGV